MSSYYRVLLFLFFGLSAIPSMAQKIFSTDHAYQADLCVVVVEHEYQADLLVYKEDHEYQATGNEGKWYFVDKEYQSDVNIYFVDHEYQADLKICYVSHEYQAGWQDKSKMSLLSGKKR